MRRADAGKRVLLTDRLALRELSERDVGTLHRMHSDPRVMRYIGDGSVATRASTRAWAARWMSYYGNYPGLGVWAAEARANGVVIGWFCLIYVPGTVEIEVGYRLAPEAWGRGYATEGARAVVEYGLSGLGLARIIGLTHPENVASQRVLAKAGLADVGWGNYYGRRLRLFAVKTRKPGCGRSDGFLDRAGATA